jgi:hypothetical protein
MLLSRSPKCRHSVEALAVSVSELRALVKVEDTNGLRQSVTQLRQKKVLDVIENVCGFEPRQGDELWRVEMVRIIA